MNNCYYDEAQTSDFYTPQPAKQQNTNTETAELSLLASIETTASTSTFLDPTMTDEGAITNDIGIVIGKTAELSDHDKLYLLSNAFVPGNDFEWPYQNRTSKGKVERRYLKKEHFDRCRYLTFSQSKNGLFCRFCVLFASPTIGNNKIQKPGSLVIKPFTNYARMFGSQGTINNHTSTDYHRCAIEIAEEFKKRSKDRSRRIENILNTNRAQQIKDNRERLKPIIKSILFCGRNGLALRGHRDYGKFTLDQPTEKDGNLRALLQFRAESGDVAVSEKILTAPKNARYLHYEIQN